MYGGPFAATAPSRENPPKQAKRTNPGWQFAKRTFFLPTTIAVWGCTLSDDFIAVQAFDASAAESDFPPSATVNPNDGTGGGDNIGCNARCGAEQCPCFSNTVSITTADGQVFWLDATEVTVAEYARFLANSPTLNPVPPKADAGTSPEGQCGWNETYVPAETSYDLDIRCEIDFDFARFLAESPQRPIVCVDWCDARDYCAWKGGHLCGLIDGADLDGTTAGSTEDAWYSACSANGTQVYSYGTTFQRNACNIAESGNGGISIAVSSLPTCEGPVTGLFDMTGNVDEWVDYCEPKHPVAQTEALCFRVGGAFFQPEPEQSRCDSTLAGRRSTLGNNTGLRCCYDQE